MWRKLSGGAALLILLAAIFVFNVPAAVGYQVADWRAGKVGSQVVRANNAFGLNMTHRLAATEQGNVFISPLSISSSLLLAYNGATGTTQEAMADTLALGNMSKQQIRSEYRALLGSLRHVDSSIQLQIANSVWIKDSFSSQVRQSYRKQVEQAFDAQVFVEPFNQATVKKMNAWVKRKTNGKIPAIIKRFRQREVMFLVNALYFKGAWSDRFKKSDTETTEFTTPNGTVTVKMMSQRDEFQYTETGRFKLVRLPYGREVIAMYVLLPRQQGQTKPASVTAMLEDTSPQELRKAINQAEQQKVEVKLPRFEMRYRKGLKQTLRAMGMDPAFQAGGFNGIANSTRLAISRVTHKTYVKVNEKGTEAAAVTATGVMTTSAPRYRQFIADRPFFFIIRDDRTGTILFSGVIRNPT
ncbi:MAG: serpin family protein [Candidatus Nanohaloarchaea archaeon]|nr:serpin family protein [Candidatus Nanohaloarchaea archaeon]